MLSSKNYVHFRGSETVKVLVQGACDSYSASHPDQALVIVGGGTERGFKSVLDGTSHFGMVSSDMGPEMERWAKRSGAKLTSTVIGFDGVVSFVHPQNPIESLTMENLHDIYTGTITNWNELGGPDAAIVALSQYPGTGEYTVWRKLVIGEGGSFAAGIKPRTHKALLKEVSESPHAIGFGSAGRGVAKALKIDGVAISVDSIKSGTYPLRRALMLASDQTPDPVAGTFLSWFLDPAKGQKVLQGLGIVPVK